MCCFDSAQTVDYLGSSVGRVSALYIVCHELDEIIAQLFSPQPAVACNLELFPISYYYLSISGLAGNLTVPAVDSPTVFSLALTSTSFPELREDRNYTINVQTCTTYVCEEVPASVTVGREISTSLDVVSYQLFSALTCSIIIYNNYIYIIYN